jgi:hypothetical protein
MSDASPPLAYCTNVHAGADLATTRANLERYALAVKARFSPNKPMGVGLWLSAAAARKLREERQVEAFGDWLRDVGLVPFTFNGFPYGDFHQAVVKHRVYEPTWWEATRLDYTLDLIAIQDALLPAGTDGSISTLPIAWSNPRPARQQLSAASKQLHRVAQHLRELEARSGRRICLCLEPEPGCVLQRSGDVVRFFSEYLLPHSDAEMIRRYLRVCHDICHAAVMFERQADVLQSYHEAGIGVGKAQVSSAIRVPWNDIAAEDRPAAVAQLQSFAEDRYLHQTVSRNGAEAFHEDLSAALQSVSDARRVHGEWRIHFHVPIYLERFGHLMSTRAQIDQCIAAARQYSDVTHFEVETYAWGVLPPELRQPDLAAGIAHEMAWFSKLVAERREE